jgi:DNA helicase-2/ATP-dependent DNA helicase PcrA
MLEERVFPGRAEAALSAFHRMITELAGQVDSRPIADSLRDLMDRTGYRKMLEEENTEEAKTRLANLDELLNAAVDAGERGETIRDFLDHAALVADADSNDGRSPVSLLTMHNAKGLEFPVVFIAGLEEGLFPHSRSLHTESAMEEERRLCYVGMTRAEKKLHLTWARYRRRFGGGQPEPSIRSRFLKEVPPGLMESTRAMHADIRGLDLYAERHEVRETARRNLYTGKTYNSVENIKQFFSEKGMPVPQGLAAQPAPAAGRPVQSGAVQSGPVQSAPVKKAAKKFGPGSVIEHAKYGRGTVLRVEGAGEDTKVTVNFPSYGLKKLIAKFAGIKIE